MTGAHVNQAARQDTVGVILRQKQTLGRVSEVLCDDLPGLFGDRPAKWWSASAGYLTNMPELAARLRAIADLIEQENL